MKSLHCLIISDKILPIVSDEEDDPDDPAPSSSIDLTTKQIYAKPRQEALKKEINVLECELNSLYNKRDVMGSVEGLDKEITERKKLLDSKKKSEKEQKAARQQKLRDKQRREIQLQKQQNPDISTSVGKPDGGRPRIEAKKDTELP